jgi:hypothetical protein
MSLVGDSVVVPRTGVEPVWDCSQRILSPQRLPVPPPGQVENKKPGRPKYAYSAAIAPPTRIAPSAPVDRPPRFARPARN